jgi:hypothetical protein
MRRWPEVLLTLVLFAAAMAVVSWVVNATVPGVQTWLVESLGHTGLEICLVLILMSVGVWSWRGHRRAGRNPKGT